MKKVALVVMMVGGVIGLYSQDIHFTQNQYFPLMLNPAMVGANYALSGNVIYRNQWKAVASPYNTYGLSFDSRIKKSSNGHIFAGGIKFFGDKSGDLSLSTNDVSLNGAYHLRIGQGQYLGMGIYAGIIQRSINLSNAKWHNQYDNSLGTYNASLPSKESYGSNSYIVPDAGLGFVYTYAKNEQYMKGNDNKRLNIGMSAFHVNSPSATFLKGTGDKMYMRYVVFGNGEFGMSNTNLNLLPLIVMQIQGGAKEFLLGGYLKYVIQDASEYTGTKKGTAFYIGSMYRNRDAVITNIILEYDSYMIGFSYDVNISKLKTISRGKGAMEIFLRYVLPSPYGPDASKSRI